MGDVYVPAAFRLDDEEAWNVVADAGAATLVVASGGTLDSAFAPVVVSDDRLVVRAHLAKANPWVRSLEPQSEVLAIFLAASAYVSPLLYPSRGEDPHVVPTWNYALAQVRAHVTLHDEEEWKLEQVRALTQRFEQEHDPPWRVDDMDETYRSSQLRGIIGLELSVVSIEGKGKLSQNRPDVDRVRVREVFAVGSPGERLVAPRMSLPDEILSPHEGRLRP